MTKRLLFTILAAAAVLALATPAPAGKDTRPHPGDLEYEPLDIKTPEVAEITLDNGLAGFLVEDHEIPVVDVVIQVKTWFPAPEKTGLNDMAVWTMRNGGSEAWPSDRLNDELEFRAARIEFEGGALGATFSFNCLKKDLDAILGIFADLLIHPAFPEEKVEMKRKTMLEEILRRNDQPRRIVSREFNRLIYGDHPYAREATAASVSAISRDDLAAFHEAYVRPGSAVIGISGDVTRDEIVLALNGAFADWAPGAAEIPEVPPLRLLPPASWHYAYKDINQAYMAIGHEGINANNEDRCAVDIMNYILGGGSFTSWITEKVRSDAGLAYSTGSRYSADPWTVGVFRAYAQTKADEYSRAMQLIIEQIERMRDEGPTEEEVRKAVDSYVNSQVFDYESKAQVVRRLVQLRFQGRPLDTPERDMAAYAAMTVEDIRRVARTYLHPDRLTILVVGDRDQFDRPLEEFGEVDTIDLEAE
ncbi:MAG: insulinase family protein [Candidatus Krumholzibacteriota bacterium]|nr:insulinase family protein [Candidatus Krumholzibacteriota bacterium]